MKNIKTASHFVYPRCRKAEGIEMPCAKAILLQRSQSTIVKMQTLVIGVILNYKFDGKFNYADFELPKEERSGSSNKPVPLKTMSANMCGERTIAICPSTEGKKDPRYLLVA
jgi:hypothetical protein